jgi:hypothetical protein
MRLDQIAATAVTHLLGRVLRRAMVAALIALFALVAIYHFTIAGTLQLEMQFGLVQARLIVGGIYTALALISLAVFYGLRTKAIANGDAPMLNQPREMQIAMLVEAVMLGYALARKGERAH